MKFNRLIGALAALMLVLATGACDEGLTEINENPNDPEAVPAQYLLANAMMDGVGGAYGSHGVWYGMYLTNLWSQHLAQPVYNDEDRYTPRPGQLNSIWDAAYVGPLADLELVIGLGQERSNDNLVAVGTIMTEWQFQMLTDVYGAIPYAEALAGEEGITSPVYDPQAAVYDSIFAGLTQAEQMIDPSVTSPTFAEGDLIYGGDMESWRRFANSLRMRAAMRIVNEDAARAESEFVAAYNAGAFESNADNAVFEWGAQRPSQNPIYEHFASRPLSDFVVSAAMVDTLQSLNDPRLALYADTALSDGAYRGLQNGTLPGDYGNVVTDYSYLGESFRQPDAPSLLMSYAEVLFLEAEAVERGWIPGDAQSLWRQAIRASLEYYDVPEAEIVAYMAGLTYQGLPSIWMQEWIALYLNGGEAWALVRRTGYPQLTPAVSGAEIPNRLPYPPDEERYNPENYQVMTLFDPLWWDTE